MENEKWPKAADSPLILYIDFKNETAVFYDFRGCQAFLIICSKLNGDETFLNSDSWLASQNT